MSARTRANISDYSVNVNTQDTFVLPNNTRNFLLISNGGPGACAVSFNGSAAATNANGSIMLAANSRLVFQKSVPQSAIHAKSASTSALTVQSDDFFQSGVPPFWLLNPGNPPAIDLNFMNNRYWVNPNVFSDSSFITSARNSAATDLVWTAAAGASFNTYGLNDLRITKAGLLAEVPATNQLLNSTAPVNQSPSLGTGNWILWMNGTGSATSSAGTAVGSGFGAATNGSPNIFNLTGAGTVNITLAGSVNAFQLESGVSPTSLIVTGGAATLRNVDRISITSLANTAGPSSTLFTQFTPLSPTNASAGNSIIAAISDGTVTNTFNNNRIGTTGNDFLQSINNGSTVNTNSGSSWAVNTSGKSICTITSGTQSICFNGGTIVSTAVTWPPTAAMSTFAVGSTFGNAPNGFVERIAVWPTVRLSSAVMQSLTA